MTAFRVRSTTGANVNSGASWALAKLDIFGMSSIDAAGDTAYVSQAHAESTAASVTWAFAGTATAPTKVICGNDAADPPTALAATGTATITGTTNNLIIQGSVYMYGLTLIVGNGVNPSAIISMGGTSGFYQQFENCKFQLGGTGVSTGVIRALASGGSGAVTIWRNCEVKFALAGQGINAVNGFWHWNGGGITSGGTSPTALITSISLGAAAGGVRILIENCDFSNGSSTMNLINSAVPYAATVTFRNCKLPGSWTGLVCAAFSSSAQGRVELFNCTSAASSNNYTLKIIDGNGNIDTETTFVKTGGASDGTTQISWKLVTPATISYPCAALFTPEILYWNEQVGVSKTVSLDILRDSVTALTNADAWLEVNYPNSASLPTSALISGRVDVLTASGANASSAAAWNTSGMANPNKQTVSVTFTPLAKGFFTIRLVVAAPSTTLYADPLPTIT